MRVCTYAYEPCIILGKYKVMQFLDAFLDILVLGVPCSSRSVLPPSLLPSWRPLPVTPFPIS